MLKQPKFHYCHNFTPEYERIPYTHVFILYHLLAQFIPPHCSIPLPSRLQNSLLCHLQVPRKIPLSCLLIYKSFYRMCISASGREYERCWNPFCMKKQGNREPVEHLFLLQRNWLFKAVRLC